MGIDRFLFLVYTDVHMNSIVSITSFRKNLFDYAKLVAEEGYEIEVEKDGKRIFKLVKVTDDPKQRAKKALKLTKKLGGSWKDAKLDEEFFRGKKEKKYMSKLGNW